MGLSSYVVTIISGLFLALLIVLYNVFRSISISNKHKNKVVPQPCGALPIIGHLHLLNSQKPYFRTFAAMAHKYGPIFSLRLGCHQTLVVSSRGIAKECVKTNDKIFASRPNTAAGRYMGYNNAVFGLAPYGEYWREIRKIATLELLSSHRLEKLKHVRDSEIFYLVKDLYYYSSSSSKNDAKDSSTSSINNNYAYEYDDFSITHKKVVPLSHLLDHMTFNIMVRMIGGKRFEGETIRQEDSEAWRLRKAIKDATYLSGVFVVEDAIPWLSNWFDFQGHVSFMKRTAKEMDLILHKWMDEHLRNRAAANESGGCGYENDFMEVLISKFEEEEDVIWGHKREIVIKATALMLILTGTGSTAITLTWALSLLLNHPSVLTSAREELDTHIGKDRWVQEYDIKDLNYLQAIVKETLRLYPPAPLTGIREATHDCYVSGYHVPKGTRLLINLWKLQRDPEIWSNPDEFEPERFVTTHAHIDYQSQGQGFEFIPFSFGRRSCPGITFGLQVVHLTLARLLQGFDISPTNTKVVGSSVPVVDMSEGLGVALPKEKPLDVMLKPRLPLELYQNL